MKRLSILAVASLMFLGQSCNQNPNTNNENSANMNDTAKAEHYTFELSGKVTRQKVTFKNRYGITLTGDLYIPKNHSNEPLPALAISGPFRSSKRTIIGIVC